MMTYRRNELLNFKGATPDQVKMRITVLVEEPLASVDMVSQCCPPAHQVTEEAPRQAGWDGSVQVTCGWEEGLDTEASLMANTLMKRGSDFNKNDCNLFMLLRPKIRIFTFLT